MYTKCLYSVQYKQNKTLYFIEYTYTVLVFKMNSCEPAIGTQRLN